MNKERPLAQNSFELACDRLSQTVDHIQFEHLRWSRNEGPMLAKLVALAQSTFEGRPEFELVEEGATSNIKRFVLKVHGNRVAAVTIYLEHGRVIVLLDAIERGRCAVNPGPPISADYVQVDEQWMAAVFEQLFGRIQPLRA